MIYKVQSNYKGWIMTLMASVFFIVTSCKEDEIEPSSPPAARITNEANAYVNDWILDNMKTWYFWNTELPSAADKNQDPESFFESLINDEDRFSWIQDNYEELLNSLQGISKEAGYEFVLYKEADSNSNVIAQILYIKPSSPASSAGLKRGDIITHINGKRITVENYRELLDAIHDNHSINYKPLLVDQQKFDAENTASLAAVEYSENPNYLNKVIEVNGKKIGYYVYNFFSSGTDDNRSNYDNEMDAVFANFKASGVTDLVLDLRFNSGGSETAANNLASLIAPGATSSKLFFKREYNDNIKREILSDPSAGEEYLRSNFKTKSSNLGNQLSGNRVYVLTSSRTASASELIINGLKPYMDVFIIGDTTYGKNVGSISLYEEDDAKNKWGMQPIVLKAYNSLDQSDYANGFVPDVLNADNSLYLFPLGDVHETLLSQAIAQITGTASLGRQPAEKDRKEMIGHSLDKKRRSFNLFIEENIPVFLNK
jgi:carboxyl-terminal processing protease